MSVKYTMDSLLESGLYYKLKLHSRGRMLSTSDQAAACVEEICAACGLQVHAYWTSRDRLAKLPQGGVAEVLPRKKYGGVMLALSDVDDVELSLYWTPPADPILVLDPLCRATFNYTIAHTRGWEFAERLLLASVERANAFWGELNDFAVTQTVTFARLNSHDETVPHLGCANYLGAEYVRFFGGLSHLEQAGFQKVVPFHHGAYVYLGAFSSNSEFLAKRAEVESRLAPPGIIGAERPGGPVPHFERSARSKDITVSVDPEILAWLKGAPQDRAPGDEHPA